MATISELLDELCEKTRDGKMEWSNYLGSSFTSGNFTIHEDRLSFNRIEIISRWDRDKKLLRKLCSLNQLISEQQESMQDQRRRKAVEEAWASLMNQEGKSNTND